VTAITAVLYGRHLNFYFTREIYTCINIFEDVLQIIYNALRYVPNAVKKHDLQVPSLRQEVRTYSVTYHARLEGNPNDLATSLLQQQPHNHRPKRYYPADLVTRFQLVLCEPPSDHKQSTVIAPK
jgi:hypothetical protein